MQNNQTRCDHTALESFTKKNNMYIAMIQNVWTTDGTVDCVLSTYARQNKKQSLRC